MNLRLLLLLAFVVLPSAPAAEPVATVRPPVMVIVHGAWGGGWQFKKVAPLLEAKGWKVCRPTLSGLGEHFHRATPDIGLATHIEDIVNFILFEDLQDVVLVGHSYGGMVITGVADRIPGHLRRLVYLDARLPLDGESMLGPQQSGAPSLADRAKDGFIAPWWVPRGKPFPIDVPHPLKTLLDPLTLGNPAAARIPGTYILTVEKGTRPEDDDFFSAAERARARGWPVLQMEGDHNPHWRQPEATAELLDSLR